MLDDFGAVWRDEPATWIRDAVWGDIPLYRQELALIDTPVYQRLRRVRQLGPLAWVFPGANHTRFEHGLGVLHLARQLVLGLRRQAGFPKTGVSDLRVLLAAALLHDVGHYPFSHALEEVERPEPLPNHAEVGASTVMNQLAPVLRSVWRVDPNRVAALVAATGLAGQKPKEPIDRLWYSMLSGAVDVDRLDFLRRDALFANVPYGIVDAQRILAALRIWQSANGPALLLDEKGIGPLQSLIFGRFLMYGNVYWHHTGRILTHMIVRAVEDALESGSVSAHDLSVLDDASLLDRLRESKACTLARRLVLRIESRDLYKRAVELRPTDPMFSELIRVSERPGGRLRAEKLLTGLVAKETGIEMPPDSLWLDLPQARTFRPIEGVISRTPPPGYVNPVPWEAVSGLTASDLERLGRSVQRVRILAADRALAKSIADVWERHGEEVRLALLANSPAAF